MTEKRPRILLVDDDPAVIRMYLRALHEYAPLHAEDGIAAREILNETPVDVVLCDLEMPGLGGLDLMRWAKEHCPRALWIVVSGAGTFDAATQALKLGAFDFVCKPVPSVFQLKTVVANAVRHQALVEERAELLASLEENNRRLAESHRKLEETNAVLSEQQAMIAQDLRRAERILRALLPRALRPTGRMQVNVAYRPSQGIGGDFYGAAMLDERNLAVYVADAAGHGVSAALLAVLFHQRLCASDPATGPRPPAAVLADLKRALLEECRASGLFVTVAYALVDTVARTVTIASAGHPPAILVRGSGIVHLEKTGPALGLSEAALYEERRLALADGERLLLYTDGLTGAMSERAPRLDTIVEAIAADGADGARVVGQLLAWTARGERVDDDMTVLLVTANDGASTFDTDPTATPCAVPSDCPLSVGATEEATWVVVRGRATWRDAAVFRDTCVEAIDGGKSVIVDLSECAALDSTILGTLHELVVRAAPRGSLHLQRASETIRGLFEELAMTQVIAAIAPRAEVVPAATTQLHGSADAAAHGLVVHAHELLAGLSASNAEQFRPVIDALRGDAHG